MTQLQQKLTLPATMADKLDAVRRRTLRVRIGTAIVAAIGVLLAAMAVAMLIDWLATIYDFRWRAVLTYTTWAAAGTTLLTWIFTAWRHTRQVDQVAVKVDHEIPELEERWSTVTSLSNQGGSSVNGHAPSVHPAMFKQVATEAQHWTPRVETDRVVPLDGLIRALLFLTAITSILGLAVVLDGGRTSILLKRFWQPYTAISATEIIDITDQKVIGRGESYKIEANLIGTQVGQASLMLEPYRGAAKTITLVPRGENQDRLTHRIRSVKEPLRYRLRAGDGQTGWYEIVVADRPQLADVRLTLTPPAYTRKDPKVVNKLPRRVTALEGSHVAIAFKPKQPLQTLQLKLGPQQREQLTADHEGWYRWETTLTKSFSFQPLLTEAHGLTNLRPPTCEIKCRGDKPPVVKILTPNSQMAVRPNETIPVTFVASDDVGVYQAELVVYDEGRKVDGKPLVLDRIPVPLGEQQGAVKVKATVDLDLSQYKMTDGSELSFSIRVREDRGQKLLVSNAENQNIQAVPSKQPAIATPSTQQDAAHAAADAQTNAMLKQLTNDESNENKAANHSTAQNNPISSAPPAQTNARQLAPESQASVTTSATAKPNRQNPTSSANPNVNNATANTQPNQTGRKNSSTQQNISSTASIKQDAIEDQIAEPKPDQSADKSSEQLAADVENTARKTDRTTSTDKSDSSPTSPDSTAESRTTATQRQTLNTDMTDPAFAKINSGSNRSNKSTASNSNSGSSQNQSGNPSGRESQKQMQGDNSMADDQSNLGDPNRADQNRKNGSAQSRSAGNSQNPQSQPPSGSVPPAGNPMAQRGLDVPAAQSSSSQPMRLKIDQWAGSYDGQQRAKLEIAIAPRLEELDRALEKAQVLSRSALDRAGADKLWSSQQDRDLQRADEHVEAAIQVIEALEEQTYDTPYAFIGLQLVDINQAHIGPARRDFWRAMQTDGDSRVDSTQHGWQHTTRARELIVLLTERFQRTKTEYQMATALEKVKKMYRVFVEDSMQLLRPEGEGSRYARKMVEFDLDDEYLQRLEEVMKMRNEMRKELARILADDPRLLRRFLDAQNNRNKVLRNELDRLTERQNELNRETRAWEVTAEDKRSQLAAILLGRHIESSQDLAIAAAELHDRFETWSPLGKEVEDANFKATAEVLQEIATATRELSADGAKYVALQTRVQKVDQTPSSQAAREDEETTIKSSDSQESVEKISGDAQLLYDRFTQLEVLLRRIGSRDDRLEISYFATNRLIETRRLIEQTSAWIRQLKQQQTGNYHRSAEVSQYRLAMETDALAGKLADLEQTMVGLLQRDDGQLPQAIAEKARSLLTALDEQVAPHQLAAVYDLRRNRMPRATQKQQTAHEKLVLAGKLYDEMIEAAVKELDKLPVQDPIAGLLEDPTLDELLRELEQEVPIQEALGIPRRPSNLQIMSDWLRSGGDNSLMTGGNGNMMTNQLQRQQAMRQRQLDQAYRKAVARALKETQAEDLAKEMPQLARETTNWNRLASQLQKDLRQGADKAPPERYRRAIEQYFRQVSGAEKSLE